MIKLRHTDAELKDSAWWTSPTERLAFSRRQKTFRQTIGFIGSESLMRSVEPECNLHLITRANWRLALQAGLLNVILIEPCLHPVSHDWAGALFDAAYMDGDLEALCAASRRVGVPVVLWITADRAFHDLQGGFARLCDLAFCTDPDFAERLSRDGFQAEHLPVAIQPSIYNPFIDYCDRTIEGRPILFEGWTSILRNPTLAKQLAPLSPAGLGVIEPRGYVRAARRADTPGLSGAILGSVLPKDRLLLLKRARILIQADEDQATRQDAQRRALEAAACQTLVLHRGALSPDDPRNQIAHIFQSWADLRCFIARLRTDRVLLQGAAQKAWRVAHEGFSMGDRLATILRALRLEDEPPEPKASVVTPTFRPDFLPKTLHQFRSQTWSNKELIVVANGSTVDDWDLSLLEEKEKFVLLPTDHWAGVALNIGATRADGEYVFRLDDDDYYGVNYIKDMMLHAKAVQVDLLGKSGEYVYSTRHQKMFRRPKKAPPAMVLRSSDFSYEETPIAGFSIALRRELARGEAYPSEAYGFADSALFARAAERDLLFAVCDSLNAVVERREDIRSHTWQIEMDWAPPRYEQVHNRVSELLS